MAKPIKSILLVDDDPDDQLLFQEALAQVDTSVAYYTADNGMDALEKLNSDKAFLPDLIFMDINMPKMNGIDCLRALKSCEKLRLLPVIMYSTSKIAEYQRQCFSQGAADYIEKPNDFALLCTTIKKLIGNVPLFINKAIAP